jgi:hypothetical protein
MAADLPPIPDGFELVQPGTPNRRRTGSALPPIPPGFELVQPEGATAAQVQSDDELPPGFRVIELPPDFKSAELPPGFEIVTSPNSGLRSSCWVAQSSLRRS